MQSHRRHPLPASVVRGLAIVAAAGACGGACLVSFGEYKLEPGVGGGSTGGNTSSSGTGHTSSTGSATTSSSTSTGSASTSTGTSSTSSGMPCASPCTVDGGTGTCCGSTCADTTSDAHNCGACGHDCQGGACAGSKCQPVVLVSFNDADTPDGIAVDSTSLYWAGAGGVHKVALAGGSATMVASIPGGAVGVAVGGSTLYATDGNVNVWSVAVSGGTATKVTTINVTFGFTLGLAVDANNVYFSTWQNGVPGCEVAQAPNGGGSPTSIGTGLIYPQDPALQPFNVVVGGGFVYWTNPGATNANNTGSVMRVSVSGGTPQALATGQAFPWAIAVDGSNVYWTTLGTTTNSFSDGAVWKQPLVGVPTPTPLASGLGEPNVMAVDGTDVYFASGAMNTISRVPIAGAPSPTTLVSTAAVKLTSMAVDATSIYWSQSAIFKLAK